MLFILSGPSGVGKDSILKELLKRDIGVVKCVTCTTRSPRAGEVEGVDYNFLSRDEFERLKSEGEFLEWAEIGGNFYATPRKFVEECLSQGKDVILKIDVQGAMKVKELMPSAILIFVSPPSLEELRKRMEKRGSDPQEIERRLAIAQREMEMAKNYQYIIVNEDFEKTVEELERLLRRLKEEKRCWKEKG